jgi:hypothetical protein
VNFDRVNASFMLGEKSMFCSLKRVVME